MSEKHDSLLQPLKVVNGEEVYEGYVRKDPSRIHSIEAKNFGGQFYLSEKSDGGNRIYFYAPWYGQASALVDKKITVKGEARNSKTGKFLFVYSYVVRNDKE